MTKPGDLWKNKPDPVARLSPGPQLISKDLVIDALLRVEKESEERVGDCTPQSWAIVFEGWMML
jgi:hypothetical protein